MKGSAGARPFSFLSRLEAGRATDLLPAVNRVDLRVGIAAGLLGATATSGALIAIGSRAATVARPFNAIAGHVLGVRGSDAFGFVPRITITGIALHVIL